MFSAWGHPLATKMVPPNCLCLCLGHRATVDEGGGCALELNLEADADSWLHLPDVEAKFSWSWGVCVQDPAWPQEIPLLPILWGKSGRLSRTVYPGAMESPLRSGPFGLNLDLA